MKIFMIRHAQPDVSVRQDDIRPLTEKGLRDSKVVTQFLADKNITAIYSSPYQRCVDTVKDFSVAANLSIQTIYDFRERSVGAWVDDFNEFATKQWSDFDFKQENGESLAETQKRNVAVLQTILQKHPGESVVIGTHGTALSTIVQYYRPELGGEFFFRIAKKMPFVVVLEFEGTELLGITEVDLV